MIIITTTLAKKDGTILQVVFIQFPPTRYSLHFIPPFSEKRLIHHYQKKTLLLKDQKNQIFCFHSQNVKTYLLKDTFTNSIWRSEK